MTYLTHREAALHLCNGGKLEFNFDGTWEPGTGGNIMLVREFLDRPSPYRAAVETFQITVRGETFEVPEPVREPLEEGARYWVPSPVSADRAFEMEWCGDEHDLRRLAEGLVHLTEAAAVTHGKAMCGVA